MGQTPSVADKVKMKAIANEWMSSNLNGEKRHLSSSAPQYDARNGLWVVGFVAKRAQDKVCGRIHIGADLAVVKCTKPATIIRHLERLLPRFGGAVQTPPPENEMHAVRRRDSRLQAAA